MLHYMFRSERMERILQRISSAIFAFSFILSFILCGDLHAVRNRFYDDENAVLVKEMRDSLDEIRHEVNNHETEIRMYDEKLKSIEDIIDGLRDQFHETTQAQKEQLKGSSSNLESKLTALDTVSKGLVADLRQFKTHSNDVSTTLGLYKQKITELEKVIEQQNQNIDHLQTAMRALMDALQAKDAVSSKSQSSASNDYPAGSYRVKAGDSLEKIARNHQTTVKAIMELNGLSHDRIGVGQLLKMP